MSAIRRYILREINTHGYVVFDFAKVWAHADYPEGACRTTILNTLSDAGFPYHARNTIKVRRLIVGYVDDDAFDRFKRDYRRVTGVEMRKYVSMRWAR